MKDKLRKPANQQAFWQRETPDSNSVLLQLLSPIEIAVYKSKFKKFNYELAGMVLEIDALKCQQLWLASRDHLRQVRSILQIAKLKKLTKDPTIKAFLFLPIEKHNLPTRLFHILKGYECRNMHDVAKEQEYGLRRMRGMGNEGMAYLIKLFHDNGCISLFI